MTMEMMLRTMPMLMMMLRTTLMLMVMLTTSCRVAFLGDTRLVTIGQDGTLLQWAVY